MNNDRLKVYKYQPFSSFNLLNILKEIDTTKKNLLKQEKQHINYLQDYKGNSKTKFLYRLGKHTTGHIHSDTLKSHLPDIQKPYLLQSKLMYHSERPGRQENPKKANRKPEEFVENSQPRILVTKKVRYSDRPHSEMKNKIVAENFFEKNSMLIRISRRN